MSFRTDIGEIVEFITRNRDNYLAEMPDAKRNDLVKALYTLRGSIRWYQLTTGEQIKKLWDKVREDVELTDYVIRGTSAMIMHFHENDAQWNNLIGQMAEAVGWVAADPKMGKEITDRAPKMAEIKEHAKGSPWLFFLYIETLAPQIRPAD